MIGEYSNFTRGHSQLIPTLFHSPRTYAECPLQRSPVAALPVPGRPVGNGQRGPPDDLRQVHVLRPYPTKGNELPGRTRVERPRLALRLPGSLRMREERSGRGGPAQRECPGRGQCVLAAGDEWVSAELEPGGGCVEEASQLSDVLLVLAGQGKSDVLSEGVVLERRKLSL